MKTTNEKVIDYLLSVIDGQSAHIEQLERNHFYGKAEQAQSEMEERRTEDHDFITNNDFWERC